MSKNGPGGDNKVYYHMRGSASGQDGLIFPTRGRIARFVPAKAKFLSGNRLTT